MPFERLKDRSTGAWHIGNRSSIDPSNYQSDDQRRLKEKSVELLKRELNYKHPATLIRNLEEVIETQKVLIDKLFVERENWIEKRYHCSKDKKIQTTEMIDWELDTTDTDYKKLLENFIVLQSQCRNQIFKIEDLERKLNMKPSCNCLSLKIKPPVPQMKIQVEIYYAGGADIVEAIFASFQRELKSSFSKQSIQPELKVTVGEGQSMSHELSSPAILICPSFSRLGTDVNALFAGIKGFNKDTMLVIVHYKPEHNLPKVSSEQILSDYGYLGGIVDMGYSGPKGFYSCSVNSNAMEIILEFLMRYVK